MHRTRLTDNRHQLLWEVAVADYRHTQLTRELEAGKFGPDGTPAHSQGVEARDAARVAADRLAQQYARTAADTAQTSAAHDALKQAAVNYGRALAGN